MNLQGKSGCAARALDEGFTGRGDSTRMAANFRKFSRMNSCRPVSEIPHFSIIALASLQLPATRFPPLLSLRSSYPLRVFHHSRSFLTLPPPPQLRKRPAALQQHSRLPCSHTRPSPMTTTESACRRASGILLIVWPSKLHREAVEIMAAPLKLEKHFNTPSRVVTILCFTGQYLWRISCVH